MVFNREEQKILAENEAELQLQYLEDAVDEEQFVNMGSINEKLH